MSEAYFEILNGAVVWCSAFGSTVNHSLNILNFDASTMTLAQQATSIDFDDKILACRAVPFQRDWLILVTK